MPLINDKEILGGGIAEYVVDEILSVCGKVSPEGKSAQKRQISVAIKAHHPIATLSGCCRYFMI
jgi:hypothetical protein